jgi:hypothetical protein
MLCAALAVQLFRQQIGMQRAAAPPAPRFWKSFYGNGLATRLILPTPVFFSYVYGPSNASGTLMVRDTNLNDYGGAQNSAPVRMLNRVFGGPSLAQSYTVSSDTFAAIKLMRYLDVFRLPTSVHSSAESVLESLDSENLIATGTWGTLTPLAPYLNQMSFKLANHEESVEIRNPAPGEPKRISSISEAKDRFICPGIIAVLPSQNRHTHVLILASRYTSALVSFLTCTDGLDQLEQMWRAKGRPEFYEVIVNSEMNGNTTIVRFWPVVLHTLDGHS